MFATRRDRLASGLTAPFTPPGTIMIGRRDFLIALPERGALRTRLERLFD